MLEYAVKMRQFLQNALLSDMLAREALTEAHIDALVVVVASFHGAAPPASASVPYGHPDEVLELPPSVPADQAKPGRISYELRKMCGKGMIRKVPGRYKYTLTDLGTLPGGQPRDRQRPAACW